MSNNEKQKQLISKAAKFMKEHGKSIGTLAGIAFMDTQFDLLLMKDENYMKERKVINEEYDKKVRILKDKYIQKYIDEGKIQIK